MQRLDVIAFQSNKASFIEKKIQCCHLGRMVLEKPETGRQ
jgi:hypothetical protein